MTAQQVTTAHSLAGPAKLPYYTLTGLKRWSCQPKELPSASTVKSLHIYDFDNTLFKSPLPNPRLWNPYTVSRLQNQDVFANGGWWHDERMLEATGQGLKSEEARAWSGWWNEQIVELVQLSARQHDALSVLLTGRSERNFAELIRRMIASKRLDFDLVCLKPEAGPKSQRFSSTMQFKQAFLQDLLYTYCEAEEIKIYEDRPKQTKGFRDFLHMLNSITFPDTGRRSVKTDVIQVADQVTTLDPVVETAEVQSMVNRHNAQLPTGTRSLEIKRNVFFTAYLISPADTAKLLDLVKVPHHLAESEIKYLANSILIVPGPADQNTLARVGGLGAKQTWQVTGFSFYQSSIWAVRVVPVPPTSQPYTIQQTPLIVLATYKNTKPELAKSIKTWQAVPVEKQYILQTEVGEKIQLRIDFASDDSTVTYRSERRGVKRRYSPNNISMRNGLGAGGPQAHGIENDYDDSRRSHQNITASGRHISATRGKANGGSGANGLKNGPNQGKGGRIRRSLNKPYSSLDDMSATNPRYGSQRVETGHDAYYPLESGGSIKDASAGLPYGQ